MSFRAFSGQRAASGQIRKPSIAIPPGKLQKITREVAPATVITLNLGFSSGDAGGLRAKIKSSETSIKPAEADGGAASQIRRINT